MTAVTDIDIPEGQTNEDVAAAQALGITPKSNLKFRASEDQVSKTGQVTPGPRLESSEQISVPTEFTNINQAIATQIGQGLMGAIERIGLDKKGDTKKMFQDEIDVDLIDEDFSTSNIEKSEDGFNNFLSSAQGQAIIKDGQTRSEFITLIDTFASDLAARLDEVKSGVFEFSPNDRIARDNAGKLSDALFAFRDKLTEIDSTINSSIKEAGGVVIDAEIVMPKMEVLNLEKQFFGKKPRKKTKAPKKVKPPKTPSRN